jgi:hypothetical protein
MGHEELSLELMLKSEGRFWELGRTALNAIKAANGDAKDARPLWTPEFQAQVAQVLVGSFKIVPKTPEEIARTERRPFAERKDAVTQIIDQDRLKSIAVDLSLADYLRREAFRHIRDEGWVAACAKDAHGDDTDERVLTMNDENLLFDLTMTAHSSHIQWWAAKRLVTVAPKKALETAVLHRRDDPHGIYYLGVRIAEQAQEIGHTTLLEWIRDDPRAPQPVALAATKLLSRST